MDDGDPRQESAVDLDNGAYAVEFFRNNTAIYVRVSNQFSSGPFNGFRKAHPALTARFGPRPITPVTVAHA